MEAPRYRVVNGRHFCQETQGYLVEYELWRAGPTRLCDLTAKVNAEHGLAMGDSNVVLKLTQLIAKGRIERLARGVYAHRDSPFA